MALRATVLPIAVLTASSNVYQGTLIVSASMWIEVSRLIVRLRRLLGCRSTRTGGFNWNQLFRKAHHRSVGQLLNEQRKREVLFRLHHIVIGRDQRLALAPSAQKHHRNVWRYSP